ncbi:MAG: hypothetical protein PHV71_07545 [Eubacteriales bacterium]|nr:hypothetical protein [Eubacteriales bacterium]MDD3199914.1 hypothetical protein [Eubacteriales bacterium]MDD4630423.1 hypothetical protein [Eubacteriales bacterium]
MKLSFRIKNILIFKNTKKGFLTVEAAIFLPIFIIGVLTLAYLIKFISIEESVFHSFTDEARVLSSEARLYVSAPLFESRLKSRLYEENGDNIKGLDLDNFQYLYAFGVPGMISMDLNYQVDIKLPIPFRESLPVSESLLFRGFVGTKDFCDPMPFEEMEKQKPSHPVWVFPRSGGRYHTETCTYVSSEPRQIILSDKIRRRYESCSLCKPSGLSNGNIVYCFIEWGKAYHIGSCPSVDKYVISMEKEEAAKRGYTACTKCGGI